MANNIVIKDAGGANLVFNTLYDAASNTHRSHVVTHQQLANVDISNTNAMPVLFITNYDSTANLITFTNANNSSVISSANQTNLGGKGAIFYLSVTANTGSTANITLTINNIDPVSGNYFPILTSLPIPGTIGTTMFQLYPGLITNQDSTVNGILSRTWCANLTFTNALSPNNVTGQLTATMVV